ncbi:MULTISPECIES: hypothetical protein [Acetobacterales]|jgi:hypothetical protein|uniref:hypothetical protein n=1 Tax=Acetobacterales TaxID=3120395 RepID=UPI00040165BC|nr:MULTISPECIES: hypothetical protein [Rhodospirillales]GIX10681.1 MAG: hypothetical protein KatS3mg116_2391 [Elioraea sp.]
MPARIDDLLVLDTAVSKTDLAKYLRDREAVLPADFAGLGDGVADDTAAIQAAFDRAGADQKFCVIPPGTWNVSGTVTLPGAARGLIMQGIIRYTGSAPASVLVLGDGGTTRNGEKLYTGLNVIRATQSDWSSEADIGITVRNVDASQIELRLVSGFTIGLRTLGDGRGVEDSTFTLGRVVNCKIGLDVWCATATAWNTSIRYYGGHFACATGVNAEQDRFGIRLANAPGAYTNHNRHIFDGPNFELRQAGSNVAIPFLNETNGSAIIGRNLRMEACSPIVARHTAGAQDCEYDIAWTNTYLVGIDYTPTANRCGNAVINRHRAPASRFTRFLAGVENVRAKAFRHSATEIGVEGLCTLATSTTTATAMADFCFNGLSGMTPGARGLQLAANRGLGFVIDTTQAKEFALAHWLAFGAAGGRLFVRCFDAASNIRENIPGDVLASLTTMQWNAPAKGWNAGAPMDDANLNRRQTLRLGPQVAFAQIGIIGFDGVIELEALRLYGLPEAAPVILNGAPILPNSGQRHFAVETEVDLPNLDPGAEHLFDVALAGARQGDHVAVSLATPSRFIQVAGHVWSNNTVRVVARNVSGFSVDLPGVMLAVEVRKRGVP